MKIAAGIHRIGDNSMINAYLVEQTGGVQEAIRQIRQRHDDSS
jgi:hypothetical protein